jgi:phosphoenolpyruvate synthase/pyruvate phosphate dikinase
MKLSEISTERAADVLCELTPLVDSIITDEDLMQSLSAVVNREQTETMSVGQKLLLVSAKAGKIVPILMKKRRAEMFGILAVLNEKTPEQIASQNMLVTMMQVRDLANDRELIDFFKSCRNTGEGA